MCKGGWCVVDQGRRGLREGWGNCLKYFKRGWNRKEGGEAKILKKKGQAGSMDGCLKKGRLGLEPLYETIMFTSTLQQENNRLIRF